MCQGALCADAVWDQSVPRLSTIGDAPAMMVDQPQPPLGLFFGDKRDTGKCVPTPSPSFGRGSEKLGKYWSAKMF